MVDGGKGSLGKSGLFDWRLQRITGLVIALYILCLASFFACNEVTYETWSAFMTSTAMKVSTIAVFLSVSLHGWTGMWIIATDYVTSRMMGEDGDTIQKYFLKLCALAAVVYFVGGVAIIWGVL